MVSVAAHPETNQLGVDTGPASARMLELFQDNRSAAIAQHKTIAITVPRTTGLRRRIVPV